MPYVTPPSIPESTTCRALLIPDSTDWLAIFGGALTELIYKYNWEQVDGISVDDAIQASVLVINGFYEGCVSSGCNQPGGYALLRVNAEGHVEQLIDGEWVEPQGVNAYPAVPARTEPTPSERRCLAAANAANALQELYEQVSEVAQYDLGVAELVIRIADALLAYFFWIAPIINGVLLIAIGILEVLLQGAKYITADVWDTTFDDAIRCILYECATDDGSVVTFDYDCFMGKLAEPEVTPDWNEARARLAAQIALLLAVVGGVDSLNQLGATTVVETADCDDCIQAWCYVLDLSTDSGGWTPYGSGQGHWQSGVGIVADNVVVGVQRTILQGTWTFTGTIAHLTNIAINYDYFAGTVQSGVEGFAGAVNAFAENWANIDMTAMSDGSNQLVSVPIDIDNVFDLFLDIQSSHNAYGGSATALVVTLRGDGDKPTFLEDQGWVECP